MARRTFAIGLVLAAVAAVAAWLFVVQGLDATAGKPRSADASNSQLPAPASVPTSGPDSSKVAASEPVRESLAEPPSAVATSRWIVRGRVRYGESPVAAVRVELTLVRGEQQPTLGEASTDEAGRFEIDVTDRIAPLSEIARSLTTVLASARKRGFRAGVAMERLEGRKAGTIELDVSLERGCSVRGRVVDDVRTPVKGAQVALRNEGGVDTVTTGEDGTFESWIASSGLHSVHAAKYDVGTAIVRDLELDPATDAEVGDLVLRGAGAIRGRAVFPSGDPVADLQIVAFQEAASEQISSKYPPNDSDGAGLPRGSSRTDAAGRFSIGGLAAGAFLLSAVDAFTCEERGGRREHAPGDDGIELVVERYRLQVRVSDDTDAPLLFAQLALRSPKNRSTAIVVRDDGVYFVHGKPDEQWHVSASAPYCLPAEGSHLFVEGVYESALELTLRRHGDERGSLAIEPTTTSPVPLAGGTIWLLTRGGAQVDQAYERELDAGGRVDGLVPGSFELAVFPGAPWIRGLVSSTWFFHVNEEVEIRANEVTLVRVEARAGGRVRIIVRVPAGSDATGLGAATITRVSGPGDVNSLRPLVQMLDNGGAKIGATLVPDVALVVLELLEPGVHTLRFAAAGFHDLERTFTIAEGEFTDLELAISPR